MKANCFFRQMGMDLKRSVCSARFLLFVMAFAILLSASDVSQLESAVRHGSGSSLTVMQMIFHNLVMDKFKIIMVILLSCIYAKSFCDDYNSNFLRCILTRIDVTLYAQSRIVVNMITNVIGSVLGFSIAAIFLSAFVPLVSTEIAVNNPEIAVEYPVSYILLMGFVFGLVSAACSTAGLLFSAFQSNAFVSIAISGLLFFLIVSYITNSIFDGLSVILLLPTFTKGEETGIVDMLWNMLYPSLVIYVCGFVFRKKLEWRMKNGSI